jgi:hypothetical protein
MTKVLGPYRPRISAGCTGWSQRMTGRRYLREYQWAPDSPRGFQPRAARIESRRDKAAAARW